MFSTIFTIAAVHLIALMSLGPDCFIVMQTARDYIGRCVLGCFVASRAAVAF